MGARQHGTDDRPATSLLVTAAPAVAGAHTEASAARRFRGEGLLPLPTQAGRQRAPTAAGRTLDRRPAVSSDPIPYTAASPTSP